MKERNKERKKREKKSKNEKRKMRERMKGSKRNKEIFSGFSVICYQGRGASFIKG